MGRLRDKGMEMLNPIKQLISHFSEWLEIRAEAKKIVAKKKEAAVKARYYSVVKAFNSFIRSFYERLF